MEMIRSDILGYVVADATELFPGHVFIGEPQVTDKSRSNQHHQRAQIQRCGGPDLCLT